MWQLAALLGASFAGSFITAAAGVGGGSLLIMIMASVMPPMALVPVHGLVQLGSNGARAWMTRQHLQNFTIGWFSLGTAIAALISIWLVVSIDPYWIPLIVALFILYLSWLPLPKIGLSTTQLGLASGGLLTTLATMLVGATGPLVSAWLGQKSANRWQYTANFSTCMVIQHSAKLAVFGLAGFAFWPWISVIFAMIAAGYLGTRAGLMLLGKLPEALFKKLFKWVLTVLAIRILWDYLPQLKGLNV